jgi:integrating conjugative element protein (TIGR03756 family)
MRNKLLPIASAIMLSIGSFSSPVNALQQPSTGFGFTDLFNSALSMSCISWQPTGVCFWLECKLIYCSIQTTLRVRHYLPDAVVTVYKQPDHYPWRDMEGLRAGMDLGQSGISPPVIDLRKLVKSAESPVQRRMVDVIGNPAVSVTGELLGSTGYGCESQITPFQPYFLSSLDYYSWRYPYTELLQHPINSVVPGMREVGFRQDGDDSMMFYGSWGSVYPRNGTLMQMDDYKASAVFAERAISIATDDSAAHIYTQLDANQESGVWPPGPSHEAKSDPGKWQMVYPQPEQECHIFGDESRWQTSMDLRNKRSQSGDHAWVYWRPWECCEPKGVFLFSITYSTGGNTE